jgi:hypothetical protein
MYEKRTKENNFKTFSNKYGSLIVLIQSDLQVMETLK